MNGAYLQLARFALAGVVSAVLLLNSCSTAKSSSRVRPVVSVNTNLVVAPGFQAGKAVVKNILGAPSYSKDGSHWDKINLNIGFSPGVTLRTEKDSIVDLFLGVNGPVVRMGDNSTLCLDQLAFRKDAENVIIKTRLTLSEGFMFANVKPLADGSTYEVIAPGGVANIKGAEFRLSQNGELVVVDGTVTFSTGKEQYTVGAGEYLNPDTKTVEKVPEKVQRTILQYNEIVNQRLEMSIIPLESKPIVGSSGSPFEDLKDEARRKAAGR